MSSVINFKMGDAYQKADDRERKGALESSVRTMLEMLGEDVDREGLARTPHRVAKSMQYLTKGYAEDPYQVINDAIFHEEYDEMVIVRDIELYSLCEHHLLPFFGRAHVAYIPNGKIVGLSKIPRMIDIYARRLQVQERLTNQIAEVLHETLNPKGVAVLIEASHMCMLMRGVEKQNSSMITSAMKGAFKENLATRTEFMKCIDTSSR